MLASAQAISRQPPLISQRRSKRSSQRPTHTLTNPPEAENRPEASETCSIEKCPLATKACR